MLGQRFGAPRALPVVGTIWDKPAFGKPALAFGRKPFQSRKEGGSKETHFPHWILARALKVSPGDHPYSNG